jgi:hypothetical protein
VLTSQQVGVGVQHEAEQLMRRHEPSRLSDGLA